MYGDPDNIHRLARTAAGWADETRARAGDLDAAQGVQWVSTAASRYREGLADRAAEVRRAAQTLDELSDALHAHARAVEERLAAIAAAERFVRRKIEEASNVVEAGLDAVGDFLSDGANWVLNRVPDRLPAPGSAGWLDVAARLR